MENATIKNFFQACRHARAIEGCLPTLPEEITPRDLRICDNIEDLEKTQGRVRVSDVSARMNTTRPGITQALTHLDELGYVTKQPDPQDKRGVLVCLTERGRRLVKVFSTDYHAWVASRLTHIDPSDIESATATIYAVEAALAQEKPHITFDGNAGDKNTDIAEGGTAC